ncbi:uncharacterized protein LOC133474778 isoform X6 [Phyllopteryx taeniolatus]|uniref:uncharacterized protein LOC133474778 isoform X6 n=1 Tax=Phyllopteryx taeniolatus TaxID=161469 RepID=UPI002AD412CC|nr:uncharacterized protein LOC133474778 isoform X6 [Phyllopteryx taeniolatus]
MPYCAALGCHFQSGRNAKKENTTSDISAYEELIVPHTSTGQTEEEHMETDKLLGHVKKEATILSTNVLLKIENTQNTPSDISASEVLVVPNASTVQTAGKHMMTGTVPSFQEKLPS